MHQHLFHFILHSHNWAKIKEIPFCFGCVFLFFFFFNFCHGLNGVCINTHKIGLKLWRNCSFSATSFILIIRIGMGLCFVCILEYFFVSFHSNVWWLMMSDVFFFFNRQCSFHYRKTKKKEETKEKMTNTKEINCQMFLILAEWRFVFFSFMNEMLPLIWNNNFYVGMENNLHFFFSLSLETTVCQTNGYTGFDLHNLYLFWNNKFSKQTISVISSGLIVNK